jgi:hypothetical protein
VQKAAGVVEDSERAALEASDTLLEAESSALSKGAKQPSNVEPVKNAPATPRQRHRGDIDMVHAAAPAELVEEHSDAFEKVVVAWVETGCVDRSELRHAHRPEARERMATMDAEAEAAQLVQQIMLRQALHDVDPVADALQDQCDEDEEV